ncbi:hypothetical protein H0X09_00865 [Candidatus Saccharibacteria bacterium]|nr:hypothetical protein [Candidatus Saccharibacteria bacterium]
MKKNQNQKTQVPSFFQRVFVLAVLGVFSTMAIIQLITIKGFFEHVGYGSSSYIIYWITFTSILLPLLFFVVVYFLNPKGKRLNLPILFENIVIASSGLLTFTMLQQIRFQLNSSFRFTNGSEATLITHEAILGVSTLVLYTLMLLYFRHTKHWST